LRCQAFGMEVITYDPYLADEVAEELKVEPVELGELFARSDFITLHAALIPETEKMIDGVAIRQMKEGVRIVNTARGGLIDEAALVEGLRSGKVAGVALDVYAEEPLSAESELLGLENVVLTPHLAASTVEAQRDVGTQIVEQMLDVLREVDYRNVLNLPLVDASVLKSLRPFLSLAEKVGSLQTQLADDAIEGVEVKVKGDELDGHLKPLVVAVLKGVLEPVLHQPVNYVNATPLARERGITVSQGSMTTTDYPNLIWCRVEWEGGSRTIAGTLFSHDELRIVQIDGYRVDVRPEGIILVTHSHDRPGFIGRVGTILGQHEINISVWRYGRNEPYGEAVSFIGVDSDVPQDVLDTLSSLEWIMDVKKVKL
jgi:D-3-phosphoglycerate dehydrogenase